MVLCAQDPGERLVVLDQLFYKAIKALILKDDFSGHVAAESMDLYKFMLNIGQGKKVNILIWTYICYPTPLCCCSDNNKDND